MNARFLGIALTALAAVAAIAALTIFFSHPQATIKERLPGADQPPGVDGATATNPASAGTVVTGPGQPANIAGAWPEFRGPHRNGISANPVATPPAWGTAGPRELWSVPAGEGYGGPAIANGRVYLVDFDREKHESALRCLSLGDGQEVWRYAYPLSVKRNHGMTRTVPTVSGRFVVSMDPKCNVFCVDGTTGNLCWAINLVHDFGTAVPPWYAGQCPIVEGSAVILAPAGTDALLAAVAIDTGKLLWKSPNPRGWKMTHSSIACMEVKGRRIFVYCGSGGVAAISADSGEILWDTTDWKISIATVPTPIPLDGGRVFLSGGYNAGAMMLQVTSEGGKMTVHPVFKLGPEVFGATQQTPIYRDGRFFGIRPDGQFACISAEGKPVWASGSGTQFGLGPLLMSGNLIFAMNDSGRLTVMDTSTSKYVALAKANVIKEGHESWAPMAMAGGRLLVRDFTRLVCLEMQEK